VATLSYVKLGRSLVIHRAKAVRSYAGGQRRNQAVSAPATRAAALLPLTTLLAMPLTVREALVVATAASVATITKARAIIGNITSSIPLS
jgi:hypothetical protein